MKLSRLIKLKKDLERIYGHEGVYSAIADVQRSLSNADYDIDPVYQTHINKAIDFYENLKTVSQGFRPEIAEVYNEINAHITRKTKEYFTASYELELQYGVPGNREARRLELKPDTRTTVLSKLYNYCDWRYPGLEIGPGDGEWTKELVTCDPLYLVDVFQEFLDSSLKQFGEVYQRRLRPYLINSGDLSVLPQNQFGFVFSWNTFNYFSFETVKQYLNSVYSVLRPGGVFMFSYNDGDVPYCADFAEQYYMSYVPRSMLIPLAEMIGYEVIDNTLMQETVSWIELRKPGQLSTVKAHQALAQVRPINNNLIG